MEEYCDQCEQEGHTFRFCPKRDDDMDDTFDYDTDGFGNVYSDADPGL